MVINIFVFYIMNVWISCNSMMENMTEIDDCLPVLNNVTDEGLLCIVFTNSTCLMNFNDEVELNDCANMTFEFCTNYKNLSCYSNGNDTQTSSNSSFLPSNYISSSEISEQSVQRTTTCSSTNSTPCSPPPDNNTLIIAYSVSGIVLLISIAVHLLQLCCLLTLKKKHQKSNKNGYELRTISNDNRDQSSGAAPLEGTYIMVDEQPYTRISSSKDTDCTTGNSTNEGKMVSEPLYDLAISTDTKDKGKQQEDNTLDATTTPPTYAVVDKNTRQTLPKYTLTNKETQQAPPITNKLTMATYTVVDESPQQTPPTYAAINKQTPPLPPPIYSCLGNEEIEDQ